MEDDERPAGWCQGAISSDYEAQLALAEIARRREAERELTDRAFRAGLKSAARWFGELPFGLQMSAGLVAQRLKEMSVDVDKFFYEEDDNATNPDSPA